MNRSPFALTLAVALALTSGAARASMGYPEIIRDHLHVSCTPPCSTCHDDSAPNGGYGTVHKPFGLAMMSLGLTGRAPGALPNFLDEAKSQNQDSDGDQDTDIDALIACRDPNVPYVPPETGDAGDAGPPVRKAPPSVPSDPVPQYGCAMGRSADAESSAAAIAVDAMLVLLRRRPRSVSTKVGARPRRAP
jgi:hypothetical protein